MDQQSKEAQELQKSLTETLELYMTLDLVPVGTIILRNDVGWTVTNGYQNLVSKDLKEALKAFMDREKKREKKK